MVEFLDKSVIAQLGVADMKLPIQYAFTYPQREHNPSFHGLDLIKMGTLTFERPDMDVFRGLKMAYEAGKVGKTMPVVLNSANEVAVELFLNGKIKFLDIYDIIEKAMNRHDPIEIGDIDMIKNIDKETRDWTYKNFAR